MDKTQLISQIPIFSSLTPRDLKPIAEHLIEEGFGKDEYIFTEGDPSEWLYIVMDGTVKMVKHSPSGREMIIAVMTQGDVIGEVAVFDGGPYPATAQGMTDGRILKLQKREFVSLLSTHPAMAVAIIRDLGGRLRAALNVARDLRGELVESRIAGVLLRLAKKAGKPADGGLVMITIPLTRQDIADLVGCTIETTIRVMSRFKKEGILKDSKSRINIDVGRMAMVLKNQ